MTEEKNPKAGQFWFPASGKPYLCLAANNRGESVWSNADEHYFAFGDDHFYKHWKHEPRCDCFGWVEPALLEAGYGYRLLPVGTMLEKGDEHFSEGAWREIYCYGHRVGDPWIHGTFRRKNQAAEFASKWYVDRDADCNWCVERFRSDRFRVYRVKGVSYKTWDGMHDVHCADGTWLECTEVEARARLNPCEEADDVHPDDVTHQSLPGKKVGTAKIKWVESPDDLVYQDSVPARLFLDEYRVIGAASIRLREWTRCIHGSFPVVEGYRHGKSINGGRLELRCLRKDLPVAVPVYDPDTFTSDWGPFRDQAPVAQPVAGRRYLCLGIQKNGVVFAAQNINACDCEELKYDGRFYVGD